MLFSYHWLKELSGTKRSPARLAELLIDHSFEVESVIPYAHGLHGVVTGKVTDVKPHANADRLRVATVRIGQRESRTIVCGAPNLAVGQCVAVALPGATLPGGIKIQETELRGVSSMGMICSAKELGLGRDHAGILVLAPGTPLGKDFAVHAGLEDMVLDVKILPDRSCDALSYRGLAREIAALEGSSASFLVSLPKMGTLKKSTRVPKVSIKTDRTKRYMALLLENVTERMVPLQTRVRLTISGLQSGDALVDLTNYLMLETGQPVHAFDADMVAKGGIVVRLARNREKFILLSGTETSLAKDDMVIADTKKPLALAGIMGGQSSSIRPETKRVLFEIASFDAPSIRRTEKRYHLLTDAAYRFERGIDVERPMEAAVLLAHYIKIWGIGEGLVYRERMGKKMKPVTLVLDVPRLEKLLGTQIPLIQAVQYCSWLGLTVKKIPNQSALKVTVPLRRPDIQYPEDLAEEIGRLRGYHLIAPKPLLLPVTTLIREPGIVFKRTLKHSLAAMGFDEVKSYSFYGERSLAYVATAREDHLAVANPMNPDQLFMRTSLFPGLYQALLLNARQFPLCHMFEFGSVHHSAATGPEEHKSLALMSLVPSTGSDQMDFLAFKSKIERLFDGLKVSVTWNQPVAGFAPAYHAGRVAHLTVGNGIHLGSAGELHPTLIQRLPSGTHAYYAEFSVPVLIGQSGEMMTFHEFSRFPVARRDISLIGSKKDAFYGELETVLRTAGAPLLVSLELFDVYETETETSYSFHLAFGTNDRTLSTNEMDTVFDRMVTAASERLKYRLKQEPMSPAA